MSREERFQAQSNRFGLEVTKVGKLPARGANWLKANQTGSPAMKLLEKKVSKG